MADFSLQALNDEIVNDPNAIGYKTGGVWKADDIIAGLINDTANGASITRKLILPYEILYSIESAECLQIANDAAPAGLLSQSEQWYISALMDLESIDANDAEIFDALVDIFPTEAARPGFRGTTRSNLQAALTKAGSRAEVLWGEGKIVSILEVAHAANL